MICFFDTSSLFKLYHKEEGTDNLMEFFKRNIIEIIFLSEITLLEFDSTVWKKYRTKEINLESVKFLIQSFEKDSNKYNFIKSSINVISQAKSLLTKYGNTGLRTLDSIQLSSALEVKSLTDIYFTSDKLLKELFNIEKLPNSIDF